MDVSTLQRSLLSLGPDALGEVFSHLNAYDIASLWFVGSASLIATLSSRVRSFDLEVASHKKPIWPKFVSNFPMLHTCAIYPEKSITYLIFTEFDLTFIPADVRKVYFRFELATSALSRYRSHFRCLESISVTSAMIRKAGDVDQNTLLPDTTTQFATSFEAHYAMDLSVSSLPPGLTSLAGSFRVFEFDEGMRFPENLTRLDVALRSMPPNYLARLPPLLRHLRLEVTIHTSPLDFELALLPAGLVSLTLIGPLNPNSPKLDGISRKQHLLELSLWPTSALFTVERLVQILPPNITKIDGAWLASNTIEAAQAALLPKSLTSLGLITTFASEVLVESLPPKIMEFRQNFFEEGCVDFDITHRPIRTLELVKIDSKIANVLPLSLTSLTAHTAYGPATIDLRRYKNLSTVLFSHGSIGDSTNQLLLPPNLTSLRVGDLLDLEASPFVIPQYQSFKDLPSGMQELKLVFWDLPTSALPISLVELVIGMHTLDHRGVANLPRGLRTLTLSLVEEPTDGEWDFFLEALPRTLTDLVLKLRTSESWATELFPEDLKFLPRGLTELIVPNSAAFSAKADHKFTEFIPTTLVSLLVGGKEPFKWLHHHKLARVNANKDSVKRQHLFDDALLDTLFF